MNKLAVIVAVAKNGVIGLNNTLPWRLSADLQWFKKCTMGHSIVMGRRTYESIGKALPGRENIVLTRQRDYQAAGCEVYTGLKEALKNAANPQVFVIGGADIYRQAIPLATRLYLTVVEAEVEGDTWLPFIDLEDYELLESNIHSVDERNQYPSEMRIYQRQPQSRSSV